MTISLYEAISVDIGKLRRGDHGCAWREITITEEYRGVRRNTTVTVFADDDEDFAVTFEGKPLPGTKSSARGQGV